MMTTTGRAHLQSLTSLRFVAAMLVLVFHLSAFTRGLDPWGRLAAGGYVGVSFFFVLSGFVLTYSWDAGGTARRFYRHRFARIYPVHALFIVVAMLPFGGSPNWSALPANLLLVQAWSPDESVIRSFSGVAWSLSCEAFFYALFPLVVRWIWRVRRPLRAGGMLLVAAFVAGSLLTRHDPALGTWLFYLPPFRLVEFVTGALAAAALMNGWVPKLRVRWAGALVVASYLSVLVVPSVIGYHLEQRWMFTLAMVPSLVCLVATCARVDIVGAPSLLQRGSLVSLGQWSFCVYMAHPVVLGLTFPLLSSPQLVRALAGVVLVLLSTVGVAFAIYFMFERPAESRLRGRGQRRLSTVVTGSTTPEEAAGVEPAMRQVGPVATS